MQSPQAKDTRFNHRTYFRNLNKNPFYSNRRKRCYLVSRFQDNKLWCSTYKSHVKPCHTTNLWLKQKQPKLHDIAGKNTAVKTKEKREKGSRGR